MDNLDHSRLLDVHRVSEHPAVQEVIQVLYGELKKSGYLGKSSRKKILKHLKAVILDLYLRYKSDPVSYVAYPRSPNEYLKETRLGQLYFGYRPMMRVIDGLETLGYLETHKGFQNRSTGQSRLSRMRATASLFDLITDHSVTPDMIELEDQPVLVLRDVEGEDIPYKVSDETISMETQLHSYNEFLATHQLGLSLPIEEIRAVLIARRSNPIDYSRTQLCRIFNESLSRGGRFYKGWWQEIPSDLRRYITIDDQPTSELDYGGQHLLLLYALNEDEYPWLRGDIDPYGEENRDLMKQVFLICVNEESREKAIQAIRQEINYNHPDLTSTNQFINPLIDTTIKRHPELSDYFFSGMWAELQRQDSKIAEYVLNHMRAKKILVLPVHDSFVVQDQYIHHLYSIMKEAYQMLSVDSIPEVKLKKGANTDLSQPSFKELEKFMETEQLLKDKELEVVKKLEDYV
tara:strand:+ start:1315 stop:2697 length:1383 start_codon:yes stop_codon:yes gene_type:complete